MAVDADQKSAVTADVGASGTVRTLADALERARASGRRPAD